MTRRDFTGSFLKLAALSAGVLALAGCSTMRQADPAAMADGIRPQTVFLAGATGVIGEPLGKALVEKGYVVYGTTRHAGKVPELQAIGVKPVVLDIYDAPAVERAVAQARPDVVINELSSLPRGLKEEEMTEGLKRDNRIRVEGTRNLIAATEKAGVPKFITQSFVFYAPSDQAPTEESPLIPDDDPVYGESTRAMKNLEAQTLAGHFTPVVLRYGWIYGGKSGFEKPIEGYSTIHIDRVVDATVRAVDANLNGIYNVSEASPFVDVSKFQKAVPQWQDRVPALQTR